MKWLCTCGWMNERFAEQCAKCDCVQEISNECCKCKETSSLPLIKILPYVVAANFWGMGVNELAQSYQYKVEGFAGYGLCVSCANADMETAPKGEGECCVKCFKKKSSWNRDPLFCHACKPKGKLKDRPCQLASCKVILKRIEMGPYCKDHDFLTEEAYPDAVRVPGATAPLILDSKRMGVPSGVAEMTAETVPLVEKLGKQLHTKVKGHATKSVILAVKTAEWVNPELRPFEQDLLLREINLLDEDIKRDYKAIKSLESDLEVAQWAADRVREARVS